METPSLVFVSVTHKDDSGDWFRNIDETMREREIGVESVVKSFSRTDSSALLPL